MIFGGAAVAYTKVWNVCAHSWAKYMRPQKAAAGAGRPEFWRHSGYKNGNAKRRIAAPKTEQQRGP